MIISIYNLFSCHTEIIETIILNYHYLTKTDPSSDEIYLEFKKINTSFNDYISRKYPKIIINKLNKNYDYLINITAYPEDFKTKFVNSINNPKIFHICHDITDELLENKQIYFLTKLCNNNRYIKCDILPYQEKQYKNDIPIYIIQGDFKRRDMNILKEILNHKFNTDFRIKICCRSNTIDMNLFKDLDTSKIIFCLDKDFQEYHNEFLGCYCIIPLISKTITPVYYTNKLTSSINYGLGYKLKFLIDDELQNIYNLENAYVYKDTTSLLEIFQLSLDEFHENKYKDNIQKTHLSLPTSTNKTAVITVSFGKTDKVGIINTFPEFDYYFFTDDVSKCTNPNINVINIDISKFPTPLLATKHIKWKTHLYLPNYDYIIWVDVFITHNNKLINEIKPLLESDRFSLRTQKFTCVNDDIEWCLSNNRIGNAMADIVRYYLKSNSFNVYEKSLTYWSSAMIKNNKDIKLQNMCDELYFLLSNICYRDQFWLPYLFNKYKINSHIMKTNLFEKSGEVIRESHYYYKE